MDPEIASPDPGRAAGSATAQLDRARAGDEHAFAELVEPHRDAVLAHCYRMLGELHDAEDALQETLLRAWRAISSFDGDRLRPWLYRIATNRCLTALDARRRRALPADPTPEGTGEAASSAAERGWIGPFPDDRLGTQESPEAAVLARESIELAFVAALQHLPPRQRAALLLRDVLQFSAAETADVLEVSVASVNSALQRARAVREDLAARVRAPGAEDPGELRTVARRYAQAWEAGDADALVAMLAADARYSMPPLEQVFVGPTAIRGFLLSGPIRMRWRFLPTRANGSPAFGTYAWNDAVGAYLPLGLDVVRFAGGQVTEVVSFLDAEFAPFGLPERLTA